jgi:hypothetical protein
MYEVEVELHSSLTLALDGVGGQLHSPPALPTRNNPWYTSNKLGGFQSGSESFGEEKNHWTVAEFEPRIVQPVASSLYWLRYSYPAVNYTSEWKGKFESMTHNIYTLLHLWSIIFFLTLVLLLWKMEMNGFVWHELLFIDSHLCKMFIK